MLVCLNHHGKVQPIAKAPGKCISFWSTEKVDDKREVQWVQCFQRLFHLDRGMLAGIILDDAESLSVLVSARIELIFFLVAGIVLCFAFSRKIMLITH